MGYRTKHVLRQQLFPVRLFVFESNLTRNFRFKYLRRVSMERNKHAAAYMYLRFDVASVRNRGI